MNQKEGKDRILASAYALINENQDINKITVKAIAEHAGVGIGLINYHFRSKDYLLMEAVGKVMGEKASAWTNAAADNTADPILMLRTMLIDLMEMGAEYLYLTKIAAKFELLEGDINTPQFILPYIMQITGQDEVTAKLTAFNLISGMQSAAIRSEQFKQYTGLDINVPQDRITYIEGLLNGLRSI